MKIQEISSLHHNLSFNEWYRNEIEASDFILKILNDDASMLTCVNSNLLESYYYSFKVPKKRGGLREIFAPTLELKEIQRKIADYLIINKKQNLNVSCGFELNTNMVDGAIKHVNKDVVINIDIKDFFKSITTKMIEESLQKTFNLETVPWKFLQIVTLNGTLPTGAPSSPVLSNIYCHKLDLELLKFSKENKLIYTRYADDLTFSSNEKIYSKNIIKLISQIVRKYNLEINTKKTKIYKKSYRQEVTGLVVNEKVNLKREFRYNLKALLHNWKKHGYINAVKTFNTKYPDKNFDSTVRGWIEFYGMVKGQNNSEFKRYKRAFRILHEQENNIALFKKMLEENTINKEHSE